MTPVLAHFTGLPHGDAGEMSIIGLWPILLAIVEVIWLLATRRVRATVAAFWRTLRDVGLVSRPIVSVWVAWSIIVLFLTINHLR